LSPPATKAHVESLGIAASSITGALPAISGANLTGIETVTKSTTVPASPSAGDQWFNTSGSDIGNIGPNSIGIYTGTEWNQLNNRPKDLNESTGGTITTSGGYQYHTFTSSGSFLAAASGNIDILLVGGGGGGGGALGGGGAGAGVLYASSFAISSGTYNIVIGAGGIGGNDEGTDPLPGSAAKGESTTGFGATAYGGAGGGSAYSQATWVQANTANGGGDATGPTPRPAVQTGNSYSLAGFTYYGGYSGAQGGGWASQGGGGAGAGGNGIGGASGDGGTGVTIAGMGPNGTAFWWGGGGGGSAHQSGSGGNGGVGGGGGGSSSAAGIGNGDSNGINPSLQGFQGNTGGAAKGTGGANTGGGGGSGQNDRERSGTGGSGIVIVRIAV
jgi:hypothetical protein